MSFNARTDRRLQHREVEVHMKYLGAWILGVPTGLIVLWFLFNHAH